MEQVFSKQFLGGDSAKEGFENFFMDFVDEAHSRQSGNGCLLLDTMAEVASHQPHLCDFVNSRLQKMQECFRQGLERARRKGDLRPSADIESMATLQ